MIGRFDPPAARARRSAAWSGAEETRAAVKLAVPAYVHPMVDLRFWHRLVELAPHLRFVVLNVHNGPGALLDPAYPLVIERLRRARIRLAGYVDTDYGRRPVRDVIAEARAWVTRYRVPGVFLDQVASDFARLDHYAAAILGVRAAGAPFVVLNPGTDCHPGYADLANVIVTFEGSWEQYAHHAPRPWQLSLPAARFCHLVHTVPAHGLAKGPARAAALHAGSAMFTPGTGANPWDQLPESAVRAMHRRYPSPSAGTPVGEPAWTGRRFAVDRAAAHRAAAHRTAAHRTAADRYARAGPPAVPGVPARPSSPPAVPPGPRPALAPYPAPNPYPAH